MQSMQNVAIWLVLVAAAAVAIAFARINPIHGYSRFRSVGLMLLTLFVAVLLATALWQAATL